MVAQKKIENINLNSKAITQPEIHSLKVKQIIEQHELKMKNLKEEHLIKLKITLDIKHSF
jgi:hypothetical protein